MHDWKAVFPELEWISDTALRDKVIQTWDEACTRGGWEEGEIDAIPFTMLVATGGVSLVAHTRLVTSICRRVSETMESMGTVPIDNDTLIAGALLHDVGKLLEYRTEGDGYAVSKSGTLLRHPISGLGLAMKNDLPEEVCHIIAVHSREGEGSYRSPEAIILHHADFIAFETIKAMKNAPGAGA